MRLKYLRTKPRKVVEASPCIAEMGAMIQCWTASGVDDAKCMQTAKMLADCMKNLLSYNFYSTGICVIASAYDVIFQIFHPTYLGETPNYKNLAVFAGSYVLLRVYEFVQSELDRVARLAKKAEPLLEESGQPGWGKPQTSLEGTHFKTFMASTPHFIEKAVVAQSPDLARPPNMSISAYVHMLIDQKLITRDIGLEYIAGYEQARFGCTRYDPLPVTMVPLQNQSNRHHQYGSGRHPRQSSISNSRHGYHGYSNMSALTNDGNALHLVKNGTEVIEEEDYIRFMKTLSWILQELGWDQDAYEEECREQERVQQQRGYEAELAERERNRQNYDQDYAGSRNFASTSFMDQEGRPGNKYSRNLWAESEGIWEGSFSLLATVMITVMAIAMLRTNHIQEKWKVKLAKALEHRDKKGIRYSTRKYAFFLLPLLTLLREGLEAIVFIGGVTFDARGKSIPIAVCAGVIAGIAVGFLMYRGGNMLNLFWFFTISTCVLLLVAAGLFVRGIAAFEANTWGKKTGAQSDDDGTYDPRVNVWALNCCDQNDPNEAGWQFFNALLGWSNVASVGTIVGYCCYWLGVIAVLMSLKVRHRRSVLKESQLNQNLESVDADGPLMVDGVKAELDDTVDGECPPMEVVAKGNIKIEIDTS
ncbi:hypothetical protein BGZ76_006415 [Entomortierella beljakovae]|nr:hypothetical protein BGZ76_006415 [Entomortierella beljakovae]